MRAVAAAPRVKGIVNRYQNSCPTRHGGFHRSPTQSFSANLLNCPTRSKTIRRSVDLEHTLHDFDMLTIHQLPEDWRENIQKALHHEQHVDRPSGPTPDDNSDIYAPQGRHAAADHSSRELFRPMEHNEHGFRADDDMQAPVSVR